MITNLRNVLCKSIITDQNSNLVSYLNCVDSLIAAKLPVNLPSLQLGTLWLIKPSGKEKVKFKIRISVERPNGSKKVIFSTPEKEYSNKKRERVNFIFSGLPIEEEGYHRFVIEYFDGRDWNITSDVLLEINEKKVKK